MKTSAYFSNIHHQIIKEIDQAEFEIIIAVAWFTDKEIFNSLCKKAIKGITIHLAIMDDSINRRASSEYSRFIDCGGHVYLIPTDKTKLMHHKFCILDREKVITGSFNWSKRARKNDENIVVIEDASVFSLQYIDTFNQLLAKNHHTVIEVPKIDTQSIARRLDVINNCILLGEYNDVAKHIVKLKGLSSDKYLHEIMVVIEKPDYDAARSLIDKYLIILRGLIKFSDPIIARLKQELLTLEYQLNALSDENAELNRQISDFNYQYNLHLGDLILEYLRLKTIKTRKKYEELKEDIQDEEFIDNYEKEYKEAQQDYDQFQEGHEAFQEEDKITELNTEEQKGIKKLYRQASMLCHPDRVTEADKKQAHKIFIKLQNAYKLNDLAEIRKIYKNLSEGNFFNDISTQESEIKQLKKLISELKIKIDKLIKSIGLSVNSESYQIFKNLTEWKTYFKDKENQYKQEIINLKEEINE